jgi:GWxTD domain-containing protein
MVRPLVALLAAIVLGAAPLAAQDDITDLFNTGPFYDAAGVLRGKGDIIFYGDVSFLAGQGDSTQALLGIALSNSSFQFLKQPDGYRAQYAVEVRAKGDRGSFENTWSETVQVKTFDETIIDRETIVFQSAFSLLPGTYDLELTVRDAQSGETSESDSKLEVPALTPGAGWALSDPVLLRFYDTAASGSDRNHVLYPSHYYALAPDAVTFFVEVYAPAGAPGDQPLKLAASIAPDGGGAAISSTTLDVPSLEGSSARVYGSVPGTGMQSGIYRLDLQLQDAGGTKLAESSAKISVSAVTQWVESHWKEAMELVAYEASKNERKQLEEAPPGQRLQAWNEFWRVRDPVPATPGNEAFESYFQRLAVANAHFGTKLRPGWKSDRGQVYVTLGPPSDVLRRPLQPNTFPIEVWRYDPQNFEIVFEDRIGFGNYQMVNPGVFTNELAALQRRKERAIEQRREAERQGQTGNTSPNVPQPAAPADSTAPQNQAG